MCRFGDAPNGKLPYGLRAKRYQAASTCEAASKQHSEAADRVPCRTQIWLQNRLEELEASLGFTLSDDINLRQEGYNLRQDDDKKKKGLIARCASKIRILDQTFAKGEVIGEGKGVPMKLDDWEESRKSSSLCSCLRKKGTNCSQPRKC